VINLLGCNIVLLTTIGVVSAPHRGSASSRALHTGDAVFHAQNSPYLSSRMGVSAAALRDSRREAASYPPDPGVSAVKVATNGRRLITGGVRGEICRTP
jgi:hypothetical protein